MFVSYLFRGSKTTSALKEHCMYVLCCFNSKVCPHGKGAKAPHHRNIVQLRPIRSPPSKQRTWEDSVNVVPGCVGIADNEVVIKILKVI